MSQFDDILDKRDDVAAALFAAQLGNDLKFIDSQTTNKPNNQPPANRTNPNAFLRGPANMPPSQPVQPVIDPYEMNETTIAARPIQNLMIPLPDDIKKAMPQTNPQPQQKQTGPQQLELPMTINEKGKPQNSAQWFEYLDKKIDDMDVRWTIEIQKVGKLVRDLTHVMEKRKLIKIKSKQEQQGTINV